MIGRLLSRLTREQLLDERGVEGVRRRIAEGEQWDRAILAIDGLSEQRLLEAMAEEFDVELIDLDQTPASTQLMDRLPARVLVNHQLAPICEQDGRLVVATSNLADRTGLDELRMVSGLHVRPVLASSQQIAQALRRGLGVGAATVQSLVSHDDGVQIVDEDRSDDVDLAEAAEDASIIQFVNQVLMEAIERRATDVHIEPFESRLRVRYRVDGVLHEAMLPAQVQRFQAAIVSRLKILSHLDIAEKRLPQDGRIKLRVAEREVDVRVSVIPMLFGEAVVLRLLDRSATLLGLEALGMSSDDSSIYSKVLGTPHGIVLITGPTGSGKTTTLYASLARINDVDRKIITIEDPIEYHLEGINQIQVDTKTGLTFSRGLRAVLRHDPDVVLVGEIRDQETADIAVQASLTGHLVFSTLHTNDAPGAITRLIDMRVEPYLVASSLEMVVAQRLVRLICPGCRHPIQITDAHRIRRELGSDMPDALYEGRGCRECGGTGYRGRKGIFEVMAVSDEVRTLIMGRASAPVIRRTAVEQGMKSLRSDGWRLIRSGLTTVQEVLRVTKDEQADGRWKGAVGVTANDEVPTTKP